MLENFSQSGVIRTLNQQRVTCIQDHFGQPHMVMTQVVGDHIASEVFFADF